MNLNGRTVLITGGSSGIGLELARRLLAREGVVIVTGRDEAKLQEAKAELVKLHTIQCDVSVEADIDRLYQIVITNFSSLDVVVNNAGIMRNLELTEERPLSDLVQEIEINLKGPIWIVQRFLPHLLSRPEAAIINVSSGLAFVPMPASPVYSAAKAGLRAYTRSLRVQLAKTNVKVIELAPPAVDSALYRRLAGDNLQNIRPMPVDTLADKAIYGIGTGKVEIAPGMAKALMLLSRLAPDFALAQLSKASGY